MPVTATAFVVSELCFALSVVGTCTKNGAHCAFAHGSQDLRNPTYDIREVQAIERGESPTDLLTNSTDQMSTSMEKERILNDDPKWNGKWRFQSWLIFSL